MAREYIGNSLGLKIGFIMLFPSIVVNIDILLPGSPIIPFGSLNFESFQVVELNLSNHGSCWYCDAYWEASIVWFFIGHHGSNSTPCLVTIESLWLLMVITKELGTYQPVDVLSISDGVLCALVMTG
jgi:hypothetical protein